MKEQHNERSPLTAAYVPEQGIDLRARQYHAAFCTVLPAEDSAAAETRTVRRPAATPALPLVSAKRGRCGGPNRLPGLRTAVRPWTLDNGTLKKPDPTWFRSLVTKKRGEAPEYPIITSYDLETYHA